MSQTYCEFSQFYDNLTLNVDYIKRADYLLSLVDKYNKSTGITLDLACGTGSLTLELKRRGVDVYGIDYSSDMLIVAKDKAYDENLDVLFLCQKMQNIDLYGTIDTCFCTLDSLNHLTDINDVKKTFKKVSLFMNKGGLFIFDVNTLYKHREILFNNTFVYDTKEVYCVWQNTLKDDNITVEVNLDFFNKLENNTYSRTSETFCEKAYSYDELNKLLLDSGFKVLDIFDEFTFNNVKDNTQRAIYIAEKI